MRCERMSATIRAKVCLTKQAEMERYVKVRRKYSNLSIKDNSLVPNIISHICYKCPQGVDIKKNGGDDMDVAEILGSKNLELDLAGPIEFGLPETRVCRDCHQEKPTTDFYRTRKGRGVDPSCKSCRMEEARVRRRRQSEERRQARIESRTTDKEVKFGIEMGGRRVWVCQECLRRYLKG